MLKLFMYKLFIIGFWILTCSDIVGKADISMARSEGYVKETAKTVALDDARRQCLALKYNNVLVYNWIVLECVAEEEGRVRCKAELCGICVNDP